MTLIVTSMRCLVWSTQIVTFIHTNPLGLTMRWPTIPPTQIFPRNLTHTCSKISTKPDMSRARLYMICPAHNHLTTAALSPNFYHGYNNDSQSFAVEDIDNFQPFPVAGDSYALNTYQDDSESYTDDNDSGTFSPNNATAPIVAGTFRGTSPLSW